MLNHIFRFLLGKRVMADTLMERGRFSEKRVQKFVITAVMLLLTLIDALFITGFRIEVLTVWLVAAGYDAWRITREKQLSNLPKNEQANTDTEKGNN